AAASRMRAGLAVQASGRHAADRSRSGDRAICAGLASGREPGRQPDRYGDFMAAHHIAERFADHHSPAASFLAQHWLAEEESLVRGGTGACDAPPYPGTGGGFLI